MAVTKGGFHMAHGLYHGLELGRVQAGLLVRSGPGFIQCKVLFNHLRTKYRGSNIAFPARRVVRKPDRQAELVKKLQHGGKVGILIGSRVLGVAVQNGHFRAAVVVQDAKGVGDLA